MKFCSFHFPELSNELESALKRVREHRNRRKDAEAALEAKTRSWESERSELRSAREEAEARAKEAEERLKEAKKEVENQRIQVRLRFCFRYRSCQF